MTGTEQSAGKRFTFTIDANTAQLIKVETTDGTGASHELSDEEKASLAKEGVGRLEQVFEEAFEAGINSVLGEDGREESEAKEDKVDAELRHLLLARLIDESPVRRLLRREALDRAILDTLIQHSMQPATAAPAGGDNTAGQQSRA